MNEPIDITAVEKILGVTFKDKTLLSNALTHSSLEKELPPNSRQLYFALVGDAVIYLIVLEYLIQRNPNKSTEWYSKMRQMIVSNGFLSHCLQRSGLDRHIRKIPGCNFGRTASGTSMEAIIGAIFLDQGHETTKQFVYSVIGSQTKYVSLGWKRDRSDIPKLEKDPRNAPSDLRG